MTFTQRDNSGALFKNHGKSADNHADYSGNALIDGRTYYLDAWIKEGEKVKFMSIRFKPKDHARPQQDRDIPF